VTLTVYSVSGLANRLRVLVSGLVLAEVSGRTFRMLWPRTSTCAAAFRELFVNEWPVTDVDRPERSWRAHRLPPWPRARPPVALADPRPDIFVGANNWLVDANAASTQPRLRARCVELFSQLELVPALRERVSEFRAHHFRPTMVGVHLRRGDFLRYRPDVVGNTSAALAALDRLLVAAPEAGIILCTDDGAADPGTGEVSREGVRELVQAHFGGRVVSTSPRSLDRRTPEGVQDALVDLWLLRATQMLVGTRGSSFSALAAFGRDVPTVMVAGAAPSYRRIEQVVRLTGVDWLVRRLFRAIYGHDLPFLDSWKRLTAPIRNWAKRRKQSRKRARARRAATWAARRQRWLNRIKFLRSG
jgi:hypothetical protein